MLNLFLAVAGIMLCFPLGVLLALGRRSKLPLIRWLCVVYIELFRGVPLYVLLLLAYVVLAAVPAQLDRQPEPRASARSSRSRCSPRPTSPRSSAAACSRCPRGQTEAAQALGLSPVRTTALIVLPQALRNVIPALVGQFISLFKDTTLAGAAMGLLDAAQRGRGRHRPDRVPGPGPDRRDARVRHAAVLGRVHHDEPREPAARAQAGSGDAMTDEHQTADRVRRRHPDRRHRRGDDRAAGRRQVLRRLSRARTASTSSVGQQEVVVVIGPSGSGKSTMIRCINRLEEHDEGRIVVDGIELTRDLRNIQEIRRETGMVFQQFNLFPHLTVLDNVTLAPRQVRRMPKKAGRGAGHGAARRRCASPSRPRSTRASCRAGSSSASPSPGRWRCSRR